MTANHDLYTDLLATFGPVLTVEEVAKLLKYPSSNAVRQAHAAGNLPVSLGRFPGRRALFARTCEVADAVERLNLQRKGEHSMAVE